ncbi:MAG: HDOD domain-containing protein [Desulfobacteraceae bacterium]|nr:MAG: HDOD domain-containing protein [Desulfobacteraceae bacterium]
MRNNRIYHVATGNYMIHATADITLEAFLGTCVGVAMFDPGTGIGGLIHFLLPEPVSMAYPKEPGKYVTTGMPLFLHELLKHGAKKENLKAWVAGGALMEPLTRHDIALDIGGRNADAAIKFLQQESIRIEHVETGGFFTCTLSLNMKNWVPEIRPAGEPLSESHEKIQPPTPEEMERAFASIKPIPQAAIKAMRMLDEEGSSFKDIANEIRKDQIITASVLRICNSALFKGNAKIDTLDDALIILGRDALVKSILLAAINNYFGQSGTGYALCYGGLYHHAVSSAIIAEKLARESGKVRPQTAYTAGLLHDIGMVVLDQALAASSPLFYRNMQKKKANILTVEKQIFGMDHCEAGKKLAGKWSFPPNLADCISSHHSPEKTRNSPRLSHIIFLTELIMSRFHTSLELVPISVEYFQASLEKLGLSISRFPDIVNLIPIEALGTDPDKASMLVGGS